jgi:broad specificity phosphatase PhoE
LQALGIELNVKTGHLAYSRNFQPLKLNFELVFVRHGETYGNCGQSTAKGRIDSRLVKSKIKNTEQRIFQGNVDTEINQLTEVGRLQAEEAANKLDEELLSYNWMPSVIYHSPLTRAKETGLPFVKRNNFQDMYVPCDGIREMAFGVWDNQRVCDLASTNVCHSFYRNQNALVRNVDSRTQMPSESFCDVLQRAYATLLELNEKHPDGRVIMFSHSMFGAACCILLGKGQKIENGSYLAFDGKRSNGASYTMPHATPFHFNVERPALSKICRL